MVSIHIIYAPDITGDNKWLMSVYTFCLDFWFGDSDIIVKSLERKQWENKEINKCSGLARWSITNE